jgi:hypothetical protein
VVDNLVTKARNELRGALSRYHKNQAIRFKRDHRKYWVDIRKIYPQPGTEVTNLINVDTGERIPEHRMPEEINNFFVGIGATLAEKFTDIRDEDKRYTPVENTMKFDIGEVNQEDVLEKIKLISIYKSSGMDNISAAFVKGALTVLNKEFTHLCNIIIETGKFPDKWKVATVTPIPKVTNPQSCNDLRPISLLPLPGRIWNRLSTTK